MYALESEVNGVGVLAILGNILRTLLTRTLSLLGALLRASNKFRCIRRFTNFVLDASLSLNGSMCLAPVSRLLAHRRLGIRGNPRAFLFSHETAIVPTPRRGGRSERGKRTGAVSALASRLYSSSSLTSLKPVETFGEVMNANAGAPTDLGSSR